MENQKIIEHRLNVLEKESHKQGEQIDELENDVKDLTQRTNDKYSEVSGLGIKLEQSYKYQRDTIKTLTTSIDGLVAEMKETNKTYNEQFKNVDIRFNSIENKLTEISSSKASSISSIADTSQEQGDNLGKTQKGAIFLGIIGVIEVFVRYVAPLFFN